MLLCVIPDSFPVVAASIATFEQLKQKILSSYTEVFSDQLGTQPMKAPPITIYLKENAALLKITNPHLLHKHFKEAAQMEIDNHLASGVMIKCEESSDWCSPGFFCTEGRWEASPSCYRLYQTQRICHLFSSSFPFSIPDSSSHTGFVQVLCKTGRHPWPFPTGPILRGFCPYYFSSFLRLIQISMGTNGTLLINGEW